MCGFILKERKTKVCTFALYIIQYRTVYENSLAQSLQFNTVREHSIMRNWFQINPDTAETGFGFSSFLHSIGETETGFAKPSKPGREMVSLTKPDIVHMFTLNYLLS